MPTLRLRTEAAEISVYIEVGEQPFRVSAQVRGGGGAYCRKNLWEGKSREGE